MHASLYSLFAPHSVISCNQVHKHLRSCFILLRAHNCPVLQTYEEPAEYHPVESREEDVVQSSVDPSHGTRDDRGRLVFDDAPDFRPTMTPKEVIQAGSFGG